MTVRYRVALHGFSRFERDALSFCFKHADSSKRCYEPVATLAESDFIVADADHELTEGSLSQAGRIGDTLFVGNNLPHTATAHVSRPIDPQRILSALDEMALRLSASVSVAVDAALPVEARGAPTSPELDTGVPAPNDSGAAETDARPLTLRTELFDTPDTSDAAAQPHASPSF